MSQMPDSTPVVIGVGQVAERLDEADFAARSPMDLAAAALRNAIDDCAGRGDVAAAIDTLAAIRQFEISLPGAKAPFGKSNNPPRSIAKRVGADPKRAILEIVGGQGPQKLVGEFAANIAEGRSAVSAIVGAEAISTVLAMSARGAIQNWSEAQGGEMEDRGLGMRGLLDRTLIDHGLGGTIPSYALFENARRAKRGLSLEQYRQEMGQLFAPFTEVAAQNPYAAAPTVRSAAELARVTDSNRIVAEPYPRLTVARDQVNQGAAVVLASVGMARALGVPEEKWVYIHAVTDAKEPSVLARPDLATSPAAIGSVRRALDVAGISWAEVGPMDLYSCFAIAVYNLLDAFDLSVADPRGFTVTGGLPFFGGAGNNYSSHAIAEVVQRLRAAPEAYGLVGANGGFLSKYATGIYSRRPAPWEKGNRWQTLRESEARVPVVDSYVGRAQVETYTIVAGKRGTSGAVVARGEGGNRFVATVAPDDEASLDELRKGEPFGRTIEVVAGAEDRNVFTFV